MSEDFMREHRAKEAQRLLHDDTMITAVEQLRAYALEELAEADAFDTNRIVTLQAKVRVANEFLNELMGFVVAGPPIQDEDDPL